MGFPLRGELLPQSICNLISKFSCTNRLECLNQGKYREESWTDSLSMLAVSNQIWTVLHLLLFFRIWFGLFLTTWPHNIWSVIPLYTFLGWTCRNIRLYLLLPTLEKIRVVSKAEVFSFGNFKPLVGFNVRRRLIVGGLFKCKVQGQTMQQMFWGLEGKGCLFISFTLKNLLPLWSFEFLEVSIVRQKNLLKCLI